MTKIRCLCTRNEYANIDFEKLEDKGCTHINMGTSYFLISDYESTKQHIENCLDEMGTTNLKLFIRPEPFIKNGISMYPDDENFLNLNSGVCCDILEETEAVGVVFNDFSYNKNIYDPLKREESTQKVDNAAKFYKEYIGDTGKLFGAFTSYGYTNGFEPSIVVPNFDIVFPEIYRIIYNPPRTKEWLDITIDYFLNEINGFGGLIVPTAVTYDSYITHNIRKMGNINEDVKIFLKKDVDGYCLFLNKYSPSNLFFLTDYKNGRFGVKWRSPANNRHSVRRLVF